MKIVDINLDNFDFLLFENETQLKENEEPKLEIIFQNNQTRATFYSTEFPQELFNP